jgi:outer membrane protein OmpA-like peptidoglycan-associated protein
MVEFGTGKSDLGRQAEADLRVIREWVLTQPKSIVLRIEGHADTVGPDDLNNALSADRAVAVARFLMRNAGIDFAQMQLYAMGKDRRYLVVPTPDETPEPRNRSVTIVHVAPEG